MGEQINNKGLTYALSAFVIWGILIPIIIYSLREISPLVLIHSRVLIAAPIFFILLKVSKKHYHFNFRELFSASHIFAAIILGFHWLLFIYCVNSGMSYQASFGYYLCPLIVAISGVIIFKEKLSTLQWIAICFAASGVLVLSSSLDSIPLLALLIAFTFAIYAMSGKFRKGTALSLSAYELWLMFIFGVILLPTQFTDTINSFQQSPILILTLGLFTAIPVWLYREAVERIPLSRLGFVQYTAPTLQLFTGVLYLKEPWDFKKLIAFALIWTGLFLFLKPQKIISLDCTEKCI